MCIRDRYRTDSNRKRRKIMKVKNQKCIRRLSYKSLWASRKRNVIAIFAIALTTLLFTSLFTILMSLNASYETYNFRQAGGYSDGKMCIRDRPVRSCSAG